jgi:YidC/Oxa1 family membrane protein insertase
MQQRFFTSAIIANTQFNNDMIQTVANEYDSSIVNQSSLAVNMALPEGRSGSVGWDYYFGPNRYEIMKEVAPEFGENVDFGWVIIGWINKHIVRNMFRFLETFIGNYGINIIILVLIIRIVLSPLSYKSYISMAKTKVLKPEMDELKAKYGDDMQKMQSEQMKLYQQVGVNPLSGCIPLVLQMPFLLAMFYFFPNAIELRQESFLWADDLSTYDAIISWDAHIPLLSSFYGNHVSLFTLLMTLSTILYTWSNSQLTTVQGPMKMMQYFWGWGWGSRPGRRARPAVPTRRPAPALRRDRGPAAGLTL